jgi:hypothetical protein
LDRFVTVLKTEKIAIFMMLESANKINFLKSKIQSICFRVEEFNTHRVFNFLAATTQKTNKVEGMCSTLYCVYVRYVQRRLYGVYRRYVQHTLYYVLSVLSHPVLILFFQVSKLSLEIHIYLYIEISDISLVWLEAEPTEQFVVLFACDVIV